MPLDSPQGYQHPQNDRNDLDDLRRRAGVTPAWQKSNPPPIMVPMSPSDIVTVTAALEHMMAAQEISGIKPILDRLQAFRAQKR